MHLRMGCCLLSVSLLAILPSSGAGEEPRPAPRGTSIFGTALNERDLAPYRLKGRASITGQAFLVTRLNKVFVQPGGMVVLLPVTRQTREWFERSVQTAPCAFETEREVPTGKELQARTSGCGREAIRTLLSDKRVAAYLRTTRTNPTGHFWFTKLPAGQYYVISPIAGGSSDHGRETKADGTAWTLVEVEWGERATNVVVTDQTRE